ncbi:MAG: hypothetical protein ChlgKO_12660 [Chlamydiales bacterium]
MAIQLGPREYDGRGMTELHNAVVDGDLSSVQRSISMTGSGVNAQVQGNVGNTALHLAAKANKRKITEALLKAPGIDPNIKNKSGDTAFKVACYYKSCKSLKALVSCKTVNLNLTFEDFMKRSNCVLNTIKSRACDLIMTDQEGNTFLHLLVQKEGTLDKMKMLLENGFPVDSQNNRGETALHLACKNGIKDENTSKIKLLLMYTENLEIQDESGLTPLALAIQNENLNAAKLLDTKGAKMDEIEMPDHFRNDLLKDD